MKNDDKASISLKKIICISILFIFIMAVAVTAGNVKLNNVKISLASGYEMNVLTSKKTVAEILDENHIILLEDEKVVPDLDSELSDNNTIKITKKTEEEIETPYCTILSCFLPEPFATFLVIVSYGIFTFSTSIFSIIVP